MRSIGKLLTLFFLFGLLSAQTGCKDQTARNRVKEVTDTLQVYSARVQAWSQEIGAAVCNLDLSVFDDAGLAARQSGWILCPTGTPPPPEPPDPVEDPWGEDFDE